MPILTPQAVTEQFEYCLSRHRRLKAEPVRPFGAGFGGITFDDTMIVVDGIVHSAVFNALRIGGRAEQIGDLLGELPTTFRHGEGGGWSFLNACADRGGDLWTGEHATVEKLVLLGLATKHVQLLLPRKMWHALPGGMPYFSVKL